MSDDDFFLLTQKFNEIEDRNQKNSEIIRGTVIIDYNEKVRGTSRRNDYVTFHVTFQCIFPATTFESRGLSLSTSAILFPFLESVVPDNTVINHFATWRDLPQLYGAWTNFQVSFLGQLFPMDVYIIFHK